MWEAWLEKPGASDSARRRSAGHSSCVTETISPEIRHLHTVRTTTTTTKQTNKQTNKQINKQTNSQRPTANDQRPATSDQRPATATATSATTTSMTTPTAANNNNNNNHNSDSNRSSNGSPSDPIISSVRPSSGRREGEVPGKLMIRPSQVHPAVPGKARLVSLRPSSDGRA